MVFSDFKQRYTILAASVIPKGFSDAKETCQKVLDHIQLDKNDWRMGNTKVFFKAGILGQLEELRDHRLSGILSMLQAHVRAYLCRTDYKRLLEQRWEPNEFNWSAFKLKRINSTYNCFSFLFLFFNFFILIDHCRLVSFRSSIIVSLWNSFKAAWLNMIVWPW